MNAIAEPLIVEPLPKSAPKRDKSHIFVHPELGLSKKKVIPHITVMEGVFENGRLWNPMLSIVAAICQVVGKWPHHYNLPFELSGHLPDEARETTQKGNSPWSSR